MAYNKWHNLNNLDECVQKMSLNVGTGKLHVKNSLQKWGGLGGKSLKTFYAVVVFVLAFFDSYFVEFLAAFNCREVFWKELFWRIFKFNSQQLVSRQNLLRNNSKGNKFNAEHSSITDLKITKPKLKYTQYPSISNPKVKLKGKSEHTLGFQLATSYSNWKIFNRCTIAFNLLIIYHKAKVTAQRKHLIDFLDRFFSITRASKNKHLHTSFFVHVNVCLCARCVRCYCLHAKIPFVYMCTSSMYVTVVFMNAHNLLFTLDTYLPWLRTIFK